MSPLAGWANFYVITGTAAATLTGLMFVVVTLIAGTGQRRPSDGFGAYNDVYQTPTVVHFGATLLATVLLSAPWPTLWEAGLALGALGLAGLVYSGVVARRAGRTEQYRPVFEDWLCHAILPPLGYAALLAAAVALRRYPVPALFGVAAVLMLFLALGVHNAWDIVTYVVLQRGGAGQEPPD